MKLTPLALGLTILALTSSTVSQQSHHLAQPSPVARVWPPHPTDHFEWLREEGNPLVLGAGGEFLIATVPADRWLTINYGNFPLAAGLALIERSATGDNLKANDRFLLPTTRGKIGSTFAPGSRVLLINSDPSSPRTLEMGRLLGYFAASHPIQADHAPFWPPRPSEVFEWRRTVIGNPGIPGGGELIVESVPGDRWLVLNGGEWKSSNNQALKVYERTGAGDEFRIDRILRGPIDGIEQWSPVGIRFAPGSQIIIKNSGTAHQLLSDTQFYGYFAKD